MQPSLTETAPSPQWTETLANLNILWILGIIVAMSLIRLAIVSSKSETARSVSEILESGMIAVALVFLLIRPFIIQAFFIPSPSMEPTLLGKNNSGDRILVNKFGYRLGTPHRDDVVVFLAPPAATGPDGLPPDSEFIKRLIGMPGDRIEVFAGHLSINGTMHSHTDVRQKLTEAGLCGAEAQADITSESLLQADCHVKFVEGGVEVSTNTAHNQIISKSQLAEIYTKQKDLPVIIRPGYTVLNGKKLDEPFIAEDADYDMKIFGGQPLKHVYSQGNDYRLAGQQITASEYQAHAGLPTEPLPADHYLMMGDNRNDSSDGTQWGPLEAKRVVGRAQFIFWPPSRIGAIR